MPTIPDSLAESAERYALRALGSHALGQWADFALFAGIAIEHAAKAVLAKVNPAFIAHRDFRHMLALDNANGDIALVPAGARTIGGREALDRVGHLEPSLKRTLSSDDVLEVLALRNGEAHLGSIGEAQLSKLFVAFLAAIQVLLQVEPDHWGQYSEVVKTALDERAEEVHRLVASKIATAIARFDSQFGNLAPAQRSALLAIVQNRRDAEIDNVSSLGIECPACNSEATIFGETEQTDWDVDFDHRDGTITGGTPLFTFYASELVCDACGLHLEDGDELTYAGIDLTMDNDDVDIDEWMAEAYADDDNWR